MGGDAQKPGSSTVILIINDDEGLTGSLRGVLEQGGFIVAQTPSGAEGLHLAYQLRPHLILLNLISPALHGLQILRKLRELSDVPVIAIGDRVDRSALIEGLYVGADDFISIPYAPAELIARIRALLRRIARAPSWWRRPNTLRTVGQMIVDYEARSVIVRGQDIPLTPTEFRLLTCLLSHPEDTVPYQALVHEVWGVADPGRQRHLRLYISYLRQKLEDDPAHPEYILTDRRRGYRLSTRDNTS